MNTNMFPYDYQINAYNLIINENRVTLKMPCGTGKTLVAILYAETSNIIIIFSPLKAFAQQNMEKFKSYLNDYYNILVDSDGIRDIDKIKHYFNKYRKIIISATYKSADVICDLLPYLENKNVCVVVDEFHNLTKNNMFDYDNVFCQVLVYNFRYLFLSATPKTYETCAKEIIGKIVCGYDFRDAINDELICDYDIYIPDISINDNKYKKTEIELSEKAIFLLKGMKVTESIKCITYMRTQEECCLFKDFLTKSNEYQYDNLIIKIIDSSVSQKKRNEIIKEFNEHNGVFILLSIHILDECIDLKFCDSVFFSYEFKNTTMIIQRLCRANRIIELNRNKKSKIFVWYNEYYKIEYLIKILREFDNGFEIEKIHIINHKSKKISRLLDENYINEYMINTKKIVCIKKNIICEEDSDKNKIIELFNKNVKGKKYVKDIAINHCGGEGHWLEKLMNIKPNSKNEPDINGYEMKKDSTKISFGDWSGEYLFSTNRETIDKINKGEKIILSKEQFIKYFGNKSVKKNRYSWSGKCVPRYGEWNSNGQKLIIDENKNIVALYSHSKDTRKNEKQWKMEEICIAVWKKTKMENHVNSKFNQKGFFICKKNKNGEYNKICFGFPINYKMFINKIISGDIILDSGMYHDEDTPNQRLYSQWRAQRNFWNDLIVEEF